MRDPVAGETLSKAAAGSGRRSQEKERVLILIDPRLKGSRRIRPQVAGGGAMRDPTLGETSLKDSPPALRLRRRASMRGENGVEGEAGRGEQEQEQEQEQAELRPPSALLLLRGVGPLDRFGC